MTSRRLLATIAVPAAIALASCSSSTNGKGSTVAPGGGSSGGGTPSCNSPAPASAPNDAKGLANLLQQGSLCVKSAHINLNVSAAGEAITGSGDETLDNGRVTGLDISESLPAGAGSLELIIADGKTYAKLPSSINPSDKPWVLVRSDSSNSTIQMLAKSISQTESQASIGSVNAFIQAAKSVSNKGSASVNGQSTTHYAVVVDVSKLPDSNQGKSTLIQQGINELPIDLYIDNKGRPVQLKENFTAQGQPISTTIDITKYDQPVHIQAPPADLVGMP